MNLIDELKRLENIAEQATPGQWRMFGGNVFYPESGDPIDLGSNQNANARHIVAFNPQTAIRLISALRKALWALECNTSFHRLGGIDDCDPCKVKKQIEAMFRDEKETG